MNENLLEQVVSKEYFIVDDPFIQHNPIDPQLMIEGTTIHKMTIQEISDWDWSNEQM